MAAKVNEADIQAPEAAANGSEAPRDEFDSLLAEFDATLQPKPEAPAPEAPAQPNGNGNANDAAEKLRRDLAADMDSVKTNWMIEADQALAGILQEREIARENADFESIVSEAQRDLEDLLPEEDYARRYLLSEAGINPKLAQAWQNRNNGAEGQRAFQNEFNRTVRKMRDGLKSRPDPTATHDREMVTQAITRGAGFTPQPQTERDYAKRLSKMNDREFEEHVRGLVG